MLKKDNNLIRQLGLFDSTMILMGIVIALTVIQFRYIERRVEY